MSFIVIKGINLDDIVHDKFDDVVNELYNNALTKNKNNNKLVTGKIKPIFTEVNDDWKKKNDIKCFYCGLPSYNSVTNFSIPYPKTLNEDGSINVKFYGCSFAWAMSYAEENEESSDVIYLLRLIYKRIYGLMPNELKRGLDKYDLNIYGTGNVSHYDFITINKEIDKKNI